MHITVCIDHYLFKYLTNRGDVVEVDTWVSQSGKNGMRRDWLVRDCNTGEIVTRASRSEFLCFGLLTPAIIILLSVCIVCSAINMIIETL